VCGINIIRITDNGHVFEYVPVPSGQTRFTDFAGGVASEFYMKIPETIEVLREYMRKVLDHESSLADMVFKTRMSRGYDDYRQFNDRLAALRQYRQEGIDIQPGQCVRYIITDHRSKSYQKRVKIPELADGDTQYDGAKYCEYLLRAAESILLPFGYTEKRLDEIMKGNIQGNLYGYIYENFLGRIGLVGMFVFILAGSQNNMRK